MNMAQHSKGLETQNRILHAARKLFYEKGYTNTTMREICELSDTNLGLIKYYFNGKADIALIIYNDIRASFESLISENEPDMRSSDMFFISSAIELHLCLTNQNYGQFFYELSSENSFHQVLEKTITEVLMKYASDHIQSNYFILNCISLMAIKPSLVHYSYSLDQKIDADLYVRYYLEQQLHYLGMELSKSDYYLQMLKNYYINIAEVFTPIMIKLLK